MNPIIDGLNIRFNITTQSKSDKDFYMNLYHYFDYVVKTPELNNIFEKSEEDYRERHIDLWKDKPSSDLDSDRAESQTIKLEKFNLFTAGAYIHGRIYLPIEDYKNTPGLDEDQDPVAVILVRGFKYALSLKRWDPENLKLYNRWFEGKRDQYESELKRFHVMLLDELDRAKVNVDNKYELTFDDDRSSLFVNGKEVKITLKNDKPNSHYVLAYIFQNKETLMGKHFYTDILESQFPKEKMDWRSIYRACNDINNKVSNQANLSNFLIVKTGKSGYTQVNSAYLL